MYYMSTPFLYGHRDPIFLLALYARELIVVNFFRIVLNVLLSFVWCSVGFVGPGWFKKVGETREIKFYPSFVQIRPHGTELWPKSKE